MHGIERSQPLVRFDSGSHNADSVDLLKLLIVGGVAIVAVNIIREILRNVVESPEQRSIKRSAERHERQGATVCADHIGWRCVPPKCGSRRPDISADYGVYTVIEEHETPLSMNRGHSIEQDRDLRRYATRQLNTTYRQIVTR